MRRLTLLASALFVFSGLFAQTYDAQTMAKMRAEKEAAIAMELQNPTKPQTPQNVSKDDILMQTGTVTTCDGMFYDSGGADGNYASNEDFTLTLSPATEGASIMVNFSVFNIENNYEFLEIYNGNSTSAELITTLTGTAMPTEPIIGTADGSLTFHFTSDGSVVKAGWAASVSCYTQVDNNLAALALEGTPFATAGTEKIMSVAVKNWGSAAVAAADYTVTLVDATENVLATANGVDLASDEQASIELVWTPATAGTVIVHGVVNFAADQDLTNNETGSMSIEIMSNDTYVAQVGMSETFPPSRVPFDFYYKNSASQTIYTPNQLGIGGGAITSIAYENNFATNLTDGKPVKIWIGETATADLTEGWVDPSTLTLVYDGTISLPSGRNTIAIPFTEPYIYQGGNLVIYTYRVWEDGYYSSSDKFYGTEVPGSNCTRRIASDTEFDAAAPGAGTVISWVPNTTLFFSTAGLGALSGTVTSEGSPVEGAKVQIVGAFANTMTNAAGMYSFPYLMADIYSLEISKHGYENATIADVTVVADETAVANVTLSPIMQYMVSGTVTASDTNMGVEGAEVMLEGYANYTATTDANGHYEFTGVYGGNTYDLTVSFAGYSTYTSTVAVADAHITNLDIVVEEIAYAPVGVTAEINDADEAVLTWLAPGTLTPAEFRYDNGVQTGQLGSGSGTDNTVLGSVHRVNAQIQEISWFTTAEGGPHATVNVFLFGLDDSGQPTNNVLFSAMAIENVDMQWNVLTLPTAVDAPNGFMVAMSYAGFAGLGTTTPDAEYPFVNNTQYFSGDYTAGTFAAVETLGDPTLNNNFMIRASGYDLGKNASSTFAYSKVGSSNHDLSFISNNPVITEAPSYRLSGLDSKALIDYTVYRLAQGQASEDWTQIATGVTDLTYTDNTFAPLEPGLYQFAVVANYTNDVMSNASLSNVIAKDMAVEYTVNITTNGGVDATGAMVTLTNQDGNEDHVYTMTAGATGAVFSEVWRGTYDLTISKSGFNAYSAMNIVIEEEGLSHTAQLIETIVAPFGLLATPAGANANFSWNNSMGFTDDFESYTDFEFENIGDYTQIDIDGGEAYGITNVTFPNTGYVGSYIVFNPATTSPALTDAAWAPYSGSKYLACFASQTFPNNDWIITPEVTAANGMEFSFMAKSITDQYGLERFKVGVSTTGMNQADFTFISAGSYEEAPLDWTSFSYDLSAYAGQNIYIAIQCVSNDAFVFMVDDLSVGMAKNSKTFSGYSIYKDGTEVETGVTGTSHVFENLVAGTTYTFGVKSVYTSGTSELQTIEYTHPTPMYTVTFDIKNVNSTAIAGASVTINNETIVSNAQGIATIDLEDGTYEYVITKAGYGVVNNSVTVAGAAITVNATMILGIEETVATQNVVLYPNPVAEMLTIVRTNNSSAVVEIYSNNGTMVKGFEMNETQKEISVSELNSGVYFVRIIENQTSTVKRFIKK